MSLSLSPESSDILELPVMEKFYTIQGEGAHTGTPAYFIRIGGCDVGCVWCDVKESWDASAHAMFSIEDLSIEAKMSGCDMVVVTGGEPAMYNLNSLTEKLNKLGLNTHIETSGAHPITEKWHWICLSPKKFKPTLTSEYKKADELKVVIYNKHDFEWAETHAAKVRKDCQLFLQPEWSRADKVTPLIIDYVKDNPQWRISLQTHKYMDIP